MSTAGENHGIEQWRKDAEADRAASDIPADEFEDPAA